MVFLSSVFEASCCTGLSISHRLDKIFKFRPSVWFSSKTNSKIRLSVLNFTRYIFINKRLSIGKWIRCVIQWITESHGWGAYRCWTLKFHSNRSDVDIKMRFNWLCIEIHRLEHIKMIKIKSRQRQSENGISE